VTRKESRSLGHIRHLHRRSKQVVDESAAAQSFRAFYGAASNAFLAPCHSPWGLKVLGLSRGALHFQRPKPHLRIGTSSSGSSSPFLAGHRRSVGDLRPPERSAIHSISFPPLRLLRLPLPAHDTPPTSPGGVPRGL
jgi:hypothetical protein